MNELSQRTGRGAAGAVLAFCSAAFELAEAQTQGAVCRMQRLDGLYVFAATGYTTPAGVALPKELVEMMRINGDGTVGVPGAYVSVNGTSCRARAAPGPTRCMRTSGHPGLRHRPVVQHLRVTQGR